MAAWALWVTTWPLRPDAKPAGGLAGALRADPVTTWQRRTDGRFRQGMIILAETTEIEETGAARR